MWLSQGPVVVFIRFALFGTRRVSSSGVRSSAVGAFRLLPVDLLPEDTDLDAEDLARESDPSVGLPSEAVAKASAEAEYT